MKINTQRKNLKKPLLITLAILVLMGSIGAYLLINRSNDSKDSSSTPEQRDEQKKAEDQAKKVFLEQEGPGTPENVKQSEPTKPVEVTVTAQAEDNGSVTILTRIQAVPRGECTLSISNNGQSFIDKAEVIYQPEFSSCAGFSIPVTRLGNGRWLINLKVTDGSNSYEASTNINI